VAAQSGGVVLTDTGFGLHQFFEAARNGNHSAPVSSELLHFAERHRLPVSLLATSHLAFCAARRVFRGCHLIHTRLSLSDVSALLSARDLRLPLVVHIDTAPPAQGAEPATALMDGSEQLAWVTLTQILQGANAIVTESTTLRNLLIADWGVKPERLTVLRSGAERARPASSERIAQLRREYQLGPGPIVLYAGGEKPWHDVDLLLESLVLLRAAYPEVMFLVANETAVPGPILERAAIMDVTASVRFLGGVPPEQLSDLVAIADVAVAPRPSGPFELPLWRKIVEYKMAGKAIVATRSEAVAELLTEETAILVEPGSRQGLARAIERLLGDGALRTELGEHARRECEREHDWATYARELAAVFESVLSE
jgi:glycosyltransferase involved in cell wall biosynthesis